MECFEQYWHVDWHQKPQQDWLWHWTLAYSAGEAAVLAGTAPLPLGRELHRPLFFTVGSVGADLHQGPGEARPLVIVWNSQLQEKPAGN